MPAEPELDARGRRLRVALAAVLVPDNARELRLVREWLDNWSGIGLIVVGLAYEGWGRAAHRLRGSGLAGGLLPVGIAHSIGFPQVEAPIGQWPTPTTG
jgi:hypothetical protein